MKVIYLDELYRNKPKKYDGSQLHHAFAYEVALELGPTIVAFRGPAEVNEHLVDLEDSVANDSIKSKDMMHFIIEIPEASIRETVVWQRFFIRMIARNISLTSIPVEIRGDDIIINHGKLSVSIATLSRFSGLIHVGININVGEGCPVVAIGLNDFWGKTVDFEKWARDIMESFAAEYDDIVQASYKVVGV